MSTKFVFHVMGGAKEGGHTLTSRFYTRMEATNEANRRYHPRMTYGDGHWTRRAEQTGPDADGFVYTHFDWITR